MTPGSGKSLGISGPTTDPKGFDDIKGVVSGLADSSDGGVPAVRGLKYDDRSIEASKHETVVRIISKSRTLLLERNECAWSGLELGDLIALRVHPGGESDESEQVFNKESCSDGRIGWSPGGNSSTRCMRHKNGQQLPDDFTKSRYQLTRHERYGHDKPQDSIVSQEQISRCSCPFSLEVEIQ